MASREARLKIAPALSLARSEIAVSPAGRFTVPVRVSEPTTASVLVRFAYVADPELRGTLDRWSGEPREGFFVLEPGALEQDATFEEPDLYPRLIEDGAVRVFLELVESDLRSTRRRRWRAWSRTIPARGDPTFHRGPNLPASFGRYPAPAGRGGVELLFTKAPGCPSRSSPRPIC